MNILADFDTWIICFSLLPNFAISQGNINTCVKDLYKTLTSQFLDFLFPRIITSTSFVLLRPLLFCIS